MAAFIFLPSYLPTLVGLVALVVGLFVCLKFS